MSLSRRVLFERFHCIQISTVFIFSAVCDSLALSLDASIRAGKYAQSNYYEIAIAYIILFLQCDTDIKIGLYIPKIPASFH